MQPGSAGSLPFEDASFDAAVMALVIFFVPEPERGVAEMVRVARPGATIAAYVWDIPGGGFPTQPLTELLPSFGIEPLRPPRDDVSTIPALQGLWAGAGLENVVTRSIDVERVFDSFDDWWSSCRGAAAACRGTRPADPGGYATAAGCFAGTPVPPERTVASAAGREPMPSPA